MRKDDGFTLKWYFFDHDDTSKSSLAKIEEDPVWEKAQEAVREATGISWDQVSKEIYGKVFEALGLDLSDEIIEAWKKYNKLRKLIESVENPNDRTIVELLKHEVKTSVYPYVEIFVEEKSVGRLDFDASLTLTLSGVVLTVHDKKICEVRSGYCLGTGTLKCGDRTLIEGHSKNFELPGRLDLGNGAEIQDT